VHKVIEVERCIQEISIDCLILILKKKEGISVITTKKKRKAERLMARQRKEMKYEYNEQSI